MIQDELQLYEELLTKVEPEDRVSRKRLERLKEGLEERLQALATRKDDLLTISEIGVDQIVVDEAQEFRKLSFATNMSTLKGIDPNGSQRAWDLYVKSRFIETKNPGRALVLASGTPITNTLGEMFSVQRLLGHEACTSAACTNSTPGRPASATRDRTGDPALRQIQAGQPLREFCQRPGIDRMFRAFADVVMPADLREYVRVPASPPAGGRSSPPSRRRRSRTYQQILDARIKAIEMREGPAQPGDDILLSVITDGRHAAIDLRLVMPANDNEPDNKLNLLVQNAFRIWQETSGHRSSAPGRQAFDLPGAAQMIFSDLGTINVEKTRGFSAYRWIRDELIRLGVPPAKSPSCRTTRRPRPSSACSATCGRAGALPDRLLRDDGHRRQRPAPAESAPSSRRALAAIADRAARGPDRPPGQPARCRRHLRLCDQGSLDASMWQNNERKARFIAAALSGDTSIRRLEDLGEGQANQFAMAKAIASGDERLMKKAGWKPISPAWSVCAPPMTTTCSRFAGGCGKPNATSRSRRAGSTRSARISPGLCRPSGEAFTMTVLGEQHAERKDAGRALMKEILTLVQLQQEGEALLGSIGGFDRRLRGRALRQGSLSLSDGPAAHRRRLRDRPAGHGDAARRHLPPRACAG
jgi:hypothetical protein